MLQVIVTLWPSFSNEIDIFYTLNLAQFNHDFKIVKLSWWWLCGNFSKLFFTNIFDFLSTRGEQNIDKVMKFYCRVMKCWMNGGQNFCSWHTVKVIGRRYSINMVLPSCLLSPQAECSQAQRLSCLHLARADASTHCTDLFMPMHWQPVAKGLQTVDGAYSHTRSF